MNQWFLFGVFLWVSNAFSMNNMPRETGLPIIDKEFIEFAKKYHDFEIFIAKNYTKGEQNKKILNSEIIDKYKIQINENISQFINNNFYDLYENIQFKTDKILWKSIFSKNKDVNRFEVISAVKFYLTVANFYDDVLLKKAVNDITNIEKNENKIELYNKLCRDLFERCIINRDIRFKKLAEKN